MKVADDNQELDRSLREKILRSNETNEVSELEVTEMDKLSGTELQSFIRQNWGKKISKTSNSEV